MGEGYYGEPRPEHIRPPGTLVGDELETDINRLLWALRCLVYRRRKSGLGKSSERYELKGPRSEWRARQRSDEVYHGREE